MSYKFNRLSRLKRDIKRLSRILDGSHVPRAGLCDALWSYGEIKAAIASWDEYTGDSHFPVGGYNEWLNGEEAYMNTSGAEKYDPNTKYGKARLRLCLHIQTVFIRRLAELSESSD